MKVKDLIKNLQKMPQDAIVVFASDEEGNSYHKIEFAPMLGKLLPDDDMFLQEPGKTASKADKEEYKNSDGTVAVCVN